jgi:hypothetical protein
MRKIILICTSISFFLLTSNCQTIKQKTDSIIEKENNKLNQYIGKNYANLQMDLGKPDEDFKNEKGNLEFIYNTKNMEYSVKEDLRSTQILL